MKKVFKAIDKIHVPSWLLILLISVIILRIPSFFEPFSYGDEMIYLTLGNGVRKGLVLYRDIHDNKPPLLYLTAAVAGNVFWFRTILAAWSLVTIYFFWKLTDNLFSKNKLISKISTIIFTIFTTIPLLEGQIANAENFMIGFSILAFFVLVTKKATTKNLLLGGFLFSVATLFKVPAAFDLPAIAVYWLAVEQKFSTKAFGKIAKRTALVVTGFAVPIALTFAWYAMQGALNQYFVAAFAQNVGYLSAFRPGDIRLPFLQRNAPLLTRAAIVALVVVVLWMTRKKVSKPFILATTWSVFALFAITLSERPYPHYLLQVVAPTTILFGVLVGAKKIEQVYTIFPLLLVFAVPVKYKFWHYPILPYYQRFIEFATGKINREQYFNRFDSNVNTNYAVAEFLAQSSLPEEKVFVWGDSPPIYALSRRLPPIKYVASYHIKDFSSQEETIQALEVNLPSYIVVLPKAGSFSTLSELIAKDYFLISTVGNAQIYKLFSL